MKLSFDKINKIDEHLARKMKKEREGVHSNKIRNIKEEVSSNTLEVDLRDYSEHLSANKMKTKNKWKSF